MQAPDEMELGKEENALKAEEQSLKYLTSQQSQQARTNGSIDNAD